MRYLRASPRSIARVTLVAALVVVAIGFLAGSPAFAHCDGLDGPVVGAARTALQTSNITFSFGCVRRTQMRSNECFRKRWRCAS